MIIDTFFIVGSYLLGSVPHLSLLARLRRISLDGDYHQTLWSKGGRIFGVIGVVGEFVKGILPVLVGRAIGLEISIVAFAGLAAVCGQMWPAFQRFDGEKGNSITIAMVIALMPVAALAAIFPVIIALIIRTVPRLTAKSRASDEQSVIGGSYSRSLPLGMAAYFLILPLSAWYFGEPAAVIWCCVALFILILIRRLTAGLGIDLKTGEDVKLILLRRLFYDRSTTG